MIQLNNDINLLKKSNVQSKITTNKKVQNNTKTRGAQHIMASSVVQIHRRDLIYLMTQIKKIISFQILDTE